MLEPIAPFITAVKNAGPRIYVGTTIATALLLFLPATLISALGLSEFRVAYRQEIGAALLIALSLLIAHLCFAAVPTVQVKLKMWQFQKGTRTVLAGLTNEEKEFLRPYIQQGSNTRYAPITNGVAAGLAAKGVVYRASNVSVAGQPGMNFPWNLQPYARTYLNSNRGLLN